ncbi:hypothetical protein LCGC14_0785990 [marine sediment metagenome]|uniref:Uncharacterized protein n=1 Tax=marine sediment metagenome TaxID=412755 RepID=A0A0F9QDX2_9ZZZZ
MYPGHEAIYDELVRLRKTGSGLRGVLRRRIDEQDAIITGQRAAIEELRGWVQERADGVSNLGMRVAKLEDVAQEWRGRQRSINSDIYRQMRGWLDELTRKRINGDDALDQRIQARAIELEHRIDALETATENKRLIFERRHGKLHATISAFMRRVREQFPQVATQTTEEDNDE